MNIDTLIEELSEAVDTLEYRLERSNNASFIILPEEMKDIEKRKNYMLGAIDAYKIVLIALKQIKET